MDVDLSSDNDPITSELLQKFSCLNTNDHDVLVKQFKLLLGDKCSESTAEFWLDMNNWNLQAAICSYFDYESTSQNFMLKLPSIQIVTEHNINEYLPNSSFTYCCTVTNSGDEPWPQGCTLKFCSGQQMSREERFILPQLNPGQSCQMNLQLTSPDKSGVYYSQWRFSTISGQFFGETIFIIVNVLDDLNQVTKQLSAAHIMDHLPSSIPAEPPQNVSLFGSFLPTSIDTRFRHPQRISGLAMISSNDHENEDVMKSNNNYHHNNDMINLHSTTSNNDMNDSSGSSNSNYGDDSSMTT